MGNNNKHKQQEEATGWSVKLHMVFSQTCLHIGSIVMRSITSAIIKLSFIHNKLQMKATAWTSKQITHKSLFLSVFLALY